MDPWWQTLYDDNLAEVLLDTDDNTEAEKTLEFLQQSLNLQSGQTIFDQCCGTGRLALTLARKHHVIGVDLMADYVKKANQKIHSAGLKASFYCGDALSFICPEAADIAINWWTSFGYSHEDKINQKMIDCAYRSLKNHGKYALDFMNVPGIYRHFQRDVMTKRLTTKGQITLLRRSEINFEQETMNKRWHYFLESGREIKHTSSVKLYSPAKLVALFKHAGFKNINIYGGLNGQTLTLDSPRCIVVGSKL